jgi:hypothetical protein
MTDKPDLIDLKNSLKTHSDKYTLITDIVDFVRKKFPLNIVDLKLHPQLTKLVCDVIEDRLPKNKKKINKLDVLISVMREIFAEVGLNEHDKNVLHQQVEFLHENGKIKGIRIAKKVLKNVGSWIFRKFL